MPIGINPNLELDGLNARLSPNNIVAVSNVQSAILFTNGIGISYNVGTNTFTTTSDHYLTVGVPIEFGHGSGALPTNLKPDSEDYYYNVATVPTARTFQITDTPGSTTPMTAFSTVGTGGWTIRRASPGDSYDITGLDLLRDGAYEIDIRIHGALITAAGAAVVCKPNIFGTSQVISASTQGFNITTIGLRAIQNQKYGESMSILRLVRRDAQTIYGLISTGGRMMNVARGSLYTLGGVLAFPGFTIKDMSAELTSLRIYSEVSSAMLIRNGSSAIVRRIN